MDTSSDSGSSPTNQHIVPFALGQVKKLFTKPAHRKHLLTSDIQNNDCKNIFHCHKKYILAKFHSFFKNTNEFKFYARLQHAWKWIKTDPPTDQLTKTDRFSNRVVYRALDPAVELKILLFLLRSSSPFKFQSLKKFTFPFEHHSQHLIPAYVSL